MANAGFPRMCTKDQCFHYLSFKRTRDLPTNFELKGEGWHFCRYVGGFESAMTIK